MLVNALSVDVEEYYHAAIFRTGARDWITRHVESRVERSVDRLLALLREHRTHATFFILGEVAAPGQYPYVPNMSVESAVAIAGGFSPRARRDRVTLTHTDASGSMRIVVPLGTALAPGDTVLVGERWF